MCKPSTPQLEAWNIKDLTMVRRNGYSRCRVSLVAPIPDPRQLTFAELLSRYCFLAFNYDERVVATKKSAELLMLRFVSNSSSPNVNYQAWYRRLCVW